MITNCLIFRYEKYIPAVQYVSMVHYVGMPNWQSKFEIN